MEKMNQREIEKITKVGYFNYIFFALFSLVQGLQFLVILVYSLYLSPPVSRFENTLMPEWTAHLRPEKEILCYRLFVIFVIIFHGCFLWINKKKIQSSRQWPSLYQITILETLLLSVVLFSLFKIAIYGDLLFFRGLIYIALILSFLIKIFWLILSPLKKRVYLKFPQESFRRVFSYVLDVIMPIFIFLVIYVPDRTSVMARIFKGDLLYHFDCIIMGAAWAALKGCVFYVDVISGYGMGMPILLGNLAKIFGGFTYENVLFMLICITIIYFLLCYIFLRCWFKNAAIATIGILLALKFHMFHFGVTDPFIWRHPSATPIRFCYDVLFLFFILQHIRTSSRIFLFLAATSCSLAIVHMTDSGVYLLITFFSYLLWVLIIPQYRSLILNSGKDLLWILTYFVYPIILTLLLFGMIAGSHIWTVRFWSNFTEFFSYFLNGLFALPMTTHLEEKYFYGFFMSLIIPLLYVLNFTILGSIHLTQKRDQESLIPFILSIYGLCLYHYHVGRSAHTNFFVVCIPLIYIICYWIFCLVKRLSKERGFALLGIVTFYAFLGLLLTQAFIEYPNYFALKKVSFLEDLKVMEKEYAFTKDAQLISSLTAPEEAVALICSFETAILMEADRKPFFYFFPMISSRYRDMKDFGNTYLFTQERVQKTFDQLEQQKPKYIFIEKKLYFAKIPRAYYQHYTVLTIFMKYLYANYTVHEQGEYLVALKRKN